MSWLPPRLARQHGESHRPWRPPPLRRAKPANLHYLVVEDLFRSLVGVALSPWPRVDEQGRLRFPAEEPLTFAIDRHSFERYLAKRRPRSSRRRALRIGDVFAVRVNPEALTAVADEAEEKTQLKPVLQASELLRGPVFDVTADAREITKTSFYAAVTERLTRKQAAPLEDLLEPERAGRIFTLPGRARVWSGTPAAVVTALAVLALAGLASGTALGRETSARHTLTLAGSTTTHTTTRVQPTTVSTTITRAVRTVTMSVIHTISEVSTETTPRQVTLTLTLTGDATGTVTVDPPGTDCVRTTTTSDQTCGPYQLAAETAVSLTASTKNVVWGLQACVSETCTLNLGQSLAVTADFYTNG